MAERIRSLGKEIVDLDTWLGHERAPGGSLCLDMFGRLAMASQRQWINSRVSGGSSSVGEEFLEFQAQCRRAVTNKSRFPRRQVFGHIGGHRSALHPATDTIWYGCVALGFNPLAVMGRYVRLNYMGFQMLTEKFDACLGISGSPLFVSGLHCEPFCNLANCRGLRRAVGLWMAGIFPFSTSSTLTPGVVAFFPLDGKNSMTSYAMPKNWLTILGGDGIYLHSSVPRTVIRQSASSGNCMLKMLKWSENEIPQLASALFATGSV